MTRAQLLVEIKRLNPRDRVAVLKAAMGTLRNELPDANRAKKRSGKRQRLAAAARRLRNDYAPGGELTAFAALDAEDFHA
jgi:hypothetical protein